MLKIYNNTLSIQFIILYQNQIKISSSGHLRVILQNEDIKN